MCLIFFLLFMQEGSVYLHTLQCLEFRHPTFDPLSVIWAAVDSQQSEHMDLCV